MKFVYLFCYDRCIFTRNQQRFVLMLWRNFLSFFFKFSWRTRVTTSKSTFSILLPCYSTALHHHPNEQQIKFCLNPKKLSSKITFFYQFLFQFYIKNFRKKFEENFCQISSNYWFFLIRRKKLENKNVLKIVVNISWLIYQKKENSWFFSKQTPKLPIFRMKKWYYANHIFQNKEDFQKLFRNNFWLLQS